MSDPFRKDYTPPGVVKQVLERLRDSMEIEPRKILDPSAGSGVFGQEMRKIWPKAHITAIEPRGKELNNLERHYDRVLIDRVEEDFKLLEDEKFDLIITNPPFSLWTTFVEEFVTRLASGGGFLILLGLTSWGSRSEEGYLLFKSWEPTFQWNIPGQVSYRGPEYGTDMRDYCWWGWRSGSAYLRADDHMKRLYPEMYRNSWPVKNLSRLASKDRKWVKEPGT